MALCWRYLYFAAGHETNSKSTRRWTFEPEYFSTWNPVAAAVVAVAGHSVERCFLPFHSEVECWFAVHFYHTLPRHFVRVRSPWWKEKMKKMVMVTTPYHMKGRWHSRTCAGFTRVNPTNLLVKPPRKGRVAGLLGEILWFPLKNAKFGLALVFSSPFCLTSLARVSNHLTYDTRVVFAFPK